MKDVLDRLVGRVRLMVGRALLQVIDDARQVQALQVQVRAGEVRDNVERFQEYGFSSVPHAGAEGIALAVGGSTDHVVVVAADDRRYRPKNLQPGEVVLYTDEDVAEGKHRLIFKRGQIIELRAGASSIVVSPDGITLRAPSIEMVKA